MMKNWLKKYVPTKKSINESGELKQLKSYFKSGTLWSFDKEPFARGVAAGLAGAVIPGFQFFYAALLAILLRGNLPIALGATFITNPFTALPIVYFIYYVGSLVLGETQNFVPVRSFNWDFSSFHSFWANFSAWLLQFGKGFLVGVPIVSVCLGIIGYVGTILIWNVIHIFLRKK